jgi:glycogen(starch) synthase
LVRASWPGADRRRSVDQGSEERDRLAARRGHGGESGRALRVPSARSSCRFLVARFGRAMKVLIYAPAFLPLVGGLEINTAVLARGRGRMGDEVAVVTRTPGSDAGCEFVVDRCPSKRRLLARTAWSDVVLHQNLSLRGLWPLGIRRRPLVISHHSWYRRPNGKVGGRDRLKKWIVARAAGSISVSSAIASDLGSPSKVVPNAYRDDLFREVGEDLRQLDLLFVGRLVSDKGVDLLLAALGQLAQEGLRVQLTVAGEGPERRALARQANELGLEASVRFVGILKDEQLATEYRRHGVVVIPSRYEEPFGIVALEAIASGCVVIGSAGGGLKDAIGECGLTYPNGDRAALAEGIRRLLGEPELRRQLRARAADHLRAHSSVAMVRAYREVLQAAVEAGSQ